MSSEQQPDGGAIWNVRELVGDLADEIPTTAPTAGTGASSREASGTAPTDVARSGASDGRPGIPAVGAGGASPWRLPAPPTVAPADQVAPASDPPRSRGGWVSDGESVPRTTGNSMSKATLVAGVALLVMLAVVAGAALLNTGEDDAGGSSVPPLPAAPQDVSTTVDAMGSSAEPSSPVTDVVDPEAEALSSLQQLNQQDLPQVSLDGRYAAQLASKTVGIVDANQLAANGSHTFYAADILAEHQLLRDSIGDDATVVLLLSTDYGRQQLHEGQPLWVTFALVPATSKEAVASWCAAQFPEFTGAALENHCVPRRLNPPGTT